MGLVASDKPNLSCAGHTCGFGKAGEGLLSSLGRECLPAGVEVVPLLLCSVCGGGGQFLWCTDLGSAPGRGAAGRVS